MGCGSSSVAKPKVAIQPAKVNVQKRSDNQRLSYSRADKHLWEEEMRSRRRRLSSMVYSEIERGKGRSSTDPTLNGKMSKAHKCSHEVRSGLQSTAVTNGDPTNAKRGHLHSTKIYKNVSIQVMISEYDDDLSEDESSKEKKNLSRSSPSSEVKTNHSVQENEAVTHCDGPVIFSTNVEEINCLDKGSSSGKTLDTFAPRLLSMEASDNIASQIMQTAEEADLKSCSAPGAIEIGAVERTDQFNSGPVPSTPCKDDFAESNDKPHVFVLEDQKVTTSVRSLDENTFETKYDSSNPTIEHSSVEIICHVKDDLGNSIHQVGPAPDDLHVVSVSGKDLIIAKDEKNSCHNSLSKKLILSSTHCDESDKPKDQARDLDESSDKALVRRVSGPASDTIQSIGITNQLTLDDLRKIAIRFVEQIINRAIALAHDFEAMSLGTSIVVGTGHLSEVDNSVNIRASDVSSTTFQSASLEAKVSSNFVTSCPHTQTSINNAAQREMSEETFSDETLGSNNVAAIYEESKLSLSPSALAEEWELRKSFCSPLKYSDIMPLSRESSCDSVSAQARELIGNVLANLMSEFTVESKEEF